MAQDEPQDEDTTEEVEIEADESSEKDAEAADEVVADVEAVEDAEGSAVEETESEAQPEAEEVAEPATVAKYTSEPKKLPEFRSGDTIAVHYRITEGDKTRIQPYEGIVISTKGEGMSKTFMVRRIGADNVGVERIFPLYSPNIEKIVVKRHGKVRKAKLYYLRDKQGREAVSIKERSKTGKHVAKLVKQTAAEEIAVGVEPKQE